MKIRTCPVCGRTLQTLNEYIRDGRFTVYKIVYKCICGYVSEKDRSGLTYDNISDRYHFKEN